MQRWDLSSHIGQVEGDISSLAWLATGFGGDGIGELEWVGSGVDDGFGHVEVRWNDLWGLV